MIHPRSDYQRIQDPAGLIPENEPVFILRAQDKAAADTVRYWAILHVKLGGDPKLARIAREHAAKMIAWPMKKNADLPAQNSGEKIEQPEPAGGGDVTEKPLPESVLELLQGLINNILVDVDGTIKSVSRVEITEDKRGFLFTLAEEK